MNYFGNDGTCDRSCFFKMHPWLAFFLLQTRKKYIFKNISIVFAYTANTVFLHISWVQNNIVQGLCSINKNNI